MARNPFWLRGAKGKLAGSVLQKGENGTIIRENVKPSNPQTNNQMITRVVFGTLGTAAARLRQVVGQTFEGAANDVINKRLFVRNNFPVLKNLALVTGSGQPEQYDYPGRFAPKGVRQLIPNPYIISNGSLPLPNVLSLTMADKYASDDFDSPSNAQALTEGSTYTAAQLWQLMTGVKPGQQLTLVYIDGQNGDNVAYTPFNYEEDPSQGNIVRYSEMYSARLVLAEGAGDSITIAAGTTKADILNCMESLIDQAKTSGLMWNVTGNAGLCSCFTYATGTLTFKAASLMQEFSESEYTIYAAGFIISQIENGKWQYSRSQMACAVPLWGPDVDTPYHGDTYGAWIWEAVDSYRKSGASSDKYTQQGGAADSINF